MLDLELAIKRCFDRCNLDLVKDEDCIYKYMYQYKAIAALPKEEFETIYDCIAYGLGLLQRRPGQ